MQISGILNYIVILSKKNWKSDFLPQKPLWCFSQNPPTVIHCYAVGGLQRNKANKERVSKSKTTKFWTYVQTVGR